MAKKKDLSRKGLFPSEPPVASFILHSEFEVCVLLQHFIICILLAKASLCTGDFLSALEIIFIHQSQNIYNCCTLLRGQCTIKTTFFSFFTELYGHFAHTIIHTIYK